MVIDPTHTKYLIKASIQADGVVEKPDIIGAIFGQTEGLMGNELDLRDLQKSARIGRIEVDIETKSGKTTGTILMPSAMEKVESAILAAGIETIDRIGPCKATIRVEKIEDTRLSKRQLVADRAKELLAQINEDPSQNSEKIQESVRSAVQVADIQHLPGTKLPCGPNVMDSDSIILVEGRSDVLNLLKCGVRTAIGVEGTNVPDAVKKLSEEKTTTIFVDGDRGGELVAKELIQTCDVDFVARAPDTREVEEIPHKLVMKCLKNKMSVDQFLKNAGIKVTGRGGRSGDRPARGRGRGKATDSRQGAKEGAKQGAGADKRRGREQAADDDAPARGRRGRGRKDDAKDEKPARDKPASKAKATKAKGDDPRAGVRDALSGLSGSLKAVLLDDAGEPIKEGLAVRDLADTLKSGRKKVHTVVFDGVITQRLLDIASDKKVQTVVGVKMGNVTKVPDTVEILTRDDLS